MAVEHNSDCNKLLRLGYGLEENRPIPIEPNDETLYITRDSGKMWLGDKRIGVDLEAGIGEHAIQQEGCTASGQGAYAGGIGTKATVEAQTAIGKFNAENAGALFIVGNGHGISDGERSNAFEVLENSTATLGGDKVATVTCMERYVDSELAKFDFIKVVSSLDAVAEPLPNKIYFVPKNDPQNQDLFDEWVWINKGTEENPQYDWEWVTTKQLEVDLTPYATIEYVDGVNPVKDNVLTIGSTEITEEQFKDLKNIPVYTVDTVPESPPKMYFLLGQQPKSARRVGFFIDGESIYGVTGGANTFFSKSKILSTSGFSVTKPDFSEEVTLSRDDFLLIKMLLKNTPTGTLGGGSATRKLTSGGKTTVDFSFDANRIYGAGLYFIYSDKVTVTTNGSNNTTTEGKFILLAVSATTNGDGPSLSAMIAYYNGISNLMQGGSGWKQLSLGLNDTITIASAGESPVWIHYFSTPECTDFPET